MYAYYSVLKSGNYVSLLPLGGIAAALAIYSVLRSGNYVKEDGCCFDYIFSTKQWQLCQGGWLLLWLYIQY